jgi:pilus assembly protein CpaF
VTQVTEICGMEGDVITLNDVFKLEIIGEDQNGKLIGRYKTSIARPHCMQRLAYFGLDRVWMTALGNDET